MKSLLAVGAIALGLVGAERCVAGHIAFGFAAMGLSVLGLRRVPGIWRADAAPSHGRTDWIASTCVLAALVFFRFYRLEPPGLWGDDALNGLLAFDILDGVIRSPFDLVHHSHSRFHALPNYLIAWAFRLFGAGLKTLRLPGLIAGCLSGLFVYGTARRLFGQPTALIAGLLFASAPMQIAHSKSLIQAVLGLMFQTAGVYALVRGTQDRSTRWLCAGAFSLAATIYTYHAAKIAPLVALPLIVAALRRGETTGKSFATAAAVFVFALIPAAVVFWADPGALVGRAQAVSIFDEVRTAGSPWPLLVSLARTLGVFHVEQGPQYNWFGPGDDPALTLIAAGLVLHGFATSILGWRQTRHQLLLLWFAVGLAPAIFSTEAPCGYRTLMATPPIFLWAAMPLAALWHSGRPAGDRAMRSIVMILVAGALVFDFNYYFHRAYTHRQSRWMLGERLVEMARIVRNQGSGWTGYVMSPSFTASHESLRLLSRMWDLDIRDAPSIHFALDTAPLPSRGAVYLTAPESHEALDIIGEHLSQTRSVSRYDPAPSMWWWGSSWPYQAAPPRREPIVSAMVVPTASLTAYRAVERDCPVQVTCRHQGAKTSWCDSVPFYDFFSDTFEQPTICHWRSTLKIAASQPGRLHFVSDQNLAVRIDGEKYTSPSRIPAGLHTIAITYPKPTRRVRLKVLWENERGAVELIPPEAWHAPKTRTAPHPPTPGP